jgi:hypothetical protein
VVRSAGHELLDVGGLDTRAMPGPGFGPVPGTSAARIELEVLPRAQALDLHAALGIRTIRGGRLSCFTTVSMPSSVPANRTRYSAR